MADVFKLGRLIDHYHAHEAEDGQKESFLTFLKEHYLEEHLSPNRHHDNSHKALPFKTFEHGLSLAFSR